MKTINAFFLRLFFAAIVGLVLGWGVASSFFIVQEGQCAILMKDNRADILMPGLHFTWPWQQPTYIAVNEQISTFSLPLPGGGGNNVSLLILWDVNNVSGFVSANESPDLVSALFKTEVMHTLTPDFLNATNSPESLASAILQALQQDQTIQDKGVAVKEVWVKGIVPNDANQAKIFTTMKGLAATIGNSIIAGGQAQAEQIRNTAEQNFLQAQSAALAEAATILGQGNSAAVKTMAPLYHQNPTLFKAYVDAKAKLLKAENQ